LQLRRAIGKVAAGAEVLARLVGAGEPDRDAIDEQVHALEHLVHTALRTNSGAPGLDERNAARLRVHVLELKAAVAELEGSDPRRVAQTYRRLKAVLRCVEHIHDHAERGKFRRWAAAVPTVLPQKELVLGEGQPQTARVASAVRWGLVLAVAMDSCVDGMLIGLASSVQLTSGWLMAMATAIEMCFLGYSFACSVFKDPRPSLLARAVLPVPPLAMLLAALAAFAGAGEVQQLPAFSGLIAFALVALLFLVLQELLLEANEKEGGELWQISVWLYVGLLLSLCLDVVL